MVSPIREIAIMQALEHPNIVKLESIFMNETTLFLTFELLSMNLKKYLYKIIPADTQNFGRSQFLPL